MMKFFLAIVSFSLVMVSTDKGYSQSGVLNTQNTNSADGKTEGSFFDKLKDGLGGLANSFLDKALNTGAEVIDHAGKTATAAFNTAVNATAKHATENMSPEGRADVKQNQQNAASSNVQMFIQNGANTNSNNNKQIFTKNGQPYEIRIADSLKNDDLWSGNNGALTRAILANSNQNTVLDKRTTLLIVDPNGIINKLPACGNQKQNCSDINRYQGNNNNTRYQSNSKITEYSSIDTETPGVILAFAPQIRLFGESMANFDYDDSKIRNNTIYDFIYVSYGIQPTSSYNNNNREGNITSIFANNLGTVLSANNSLFILPLNQYSGKNSNSENILLVKGLSDNIAVGNNTITVIPNKIIQIKAQTSANTTTNNQAQRIDSTTNNYFVTTSIVVGVMALIKTHFPTLTPGEIKNIILQTADKTFLVKNQNTTDSYGRRIQNNGYTLVQGGLNNDQMMAPVGIAITKTIKFESTTYGAGLLNIDLAFAEAGRLAQSLTTTAPI